MNELRLKYPVRMMRRIMNVSASGYYAWVDRPLSKRAQEEVRLELEIMAAHQRNRQTYGPERLQRDLAEHGVRVGVCRIKRIRQKLGIRCKQKRRFKTTTNSAHRLPVADNLLGQQFKVSQPNAVWVRTSPIYRLMKAGYTWRATRTCSPESSWAMPWESGDQESG